MNGKDVSIGYIESCQFCASKNMQEILDMGFFAPCDSLLNKNMLRKPEKSYPLNLKRCRDCGLVQIDYAVEAKELFYPDYPYRSGITETLKKNLHATSKHVSDRIKLSENSLVVDIGSNDGTLLEGFKMLGMRVLGVEPTKISEIAIANGVDTINEFFSADVAREIAKNRGKASVITAANVFAHIAEIRGLMEGVSELLEDNGIFVTESHYMVDILETLQYDSIYHEHLRFYLIKPLQAFLKGFGFTLVDVERISNYGGSIRVYAKKGLNQKVSDSVEELLQIEEGMKAYEDSAYTEFAEKVKNSRKELRALLVRLNEEGKSVVGIGCPGRSATLLTYCGISPDMMTYIAEQNSSLKLGLFTPGSHIPVVDEARMFEEQPDYAVMLSWHYAMPIIGKLRERGLKSKIIIPLPEVKIID